MVSGYCNGVWEISDQRSLSHEKNKFGKDDRYIFAMCGRMAYAVRRLLKVNLLDKPTSKELKLAQVMNRDMRKWLKDNNAPTGTWVKGGGKVPYPREDGIDKYKSNVTKGELIK